MASKQTPMRSLPPISCAAVASAVIMYPVDVWRALGMASATGGQAQTLGGFIRAHGVKGLLKQGLGPEIGRATLMRLMKFFNYPIVHRAMFGGREPGQGSTFSRSVAGALATIPECFFITPLELAKIGLQLDSENRFGNSTSRLLGSVKARVGPMGLMAGYLGVQGRQAAWTATYFASLPLFEAQTRVLTAKLESLLDQQPGSLGSFKTFTAGFLAGMAGAAANTPIDVVRTNLQKQALTEYLKDKPARVSFSPALMASAFTDFGQMTSRIIRERGVFALYLGFLPKAIHLGGGGALMALLVPSFEKLFYGE